VTSDTGCKRRIEVQKKEISMSQNKFPDGWYDEKLQDLVWQYRNLTSGFQIGVTMPERLQPGPLAGQISYFAPVSLLLFFLIFVITTLRSIDLHPMNYFFLAAAFSPSIC
jgi:hypothetical protein